MPKISDFMTDAKRLALNAGMMVAGRFVEVVKSGNIAFSSTTYVQKERRIGAKPYVTISCGSKLGVRGQNITIPIYLSNNDLGVGGFQVDLRWDANSITYVSDSVDARFGVVTHDTTAVGTGRLFLDYERVYEQGNIADAGMILGTVTFTVNANVPMTTPSLPLTLVGQAGSGSGTELLKLGLLNNQPYIFYITPIGMLSGSIELDHVKPPVQEVITLPVTQPVLLGGGTTGTSVVDFTLSDVALVGVGAGGSVNAIIIAYVNGVEAGRTTVRLTEGKNNLSGRFPLTLPTSNWGSVTYNVIIQPDEGDDTPYYVLIPKHGFKATITTEVNRSAGETLPHQPPIAEFLQLLELDDFSLVEIFTKFTGEVSPESDTLTILDFYVSDMAVSNLVDQSQDLINVNDISEIEIYSAPDTDKNTDTVVFVDFSDTLVAHKVDQSPDVDSIVVSDVSGVEVFTAPNADANTDVINLQDVSATDVNHSISSDDSQDTVSMEDTYLVEKG